VVEISEPEVSTSISKVVRRNGMKSNLKNQEEKEDQCHRHLRPLMTSRTVQKTQELYKVTIKKHLMSTTRRD
jgi:hypothetical protein